jgi:[protein-PII] uridylyltransferase
MKNAIPLSIAALGSYGREQLCVHSDIDLMIVYEDIPGYQSKALIEKMLYLFWDIGLKLGHRVHEVSELPEAARSDITIKSAILESRFIEGSHSLWTGAENRITLIRKEDPEKFIREKLQEQRDLHRRFPLTMEPNLKEGVGGFRDANLVYWIGKLLYNVPRFRELPSEIIEEGDYREFRIALEFLFRVRSALHLVAGKKEDRLRLERIPEIATLLGYDSTPHAQMRFAKKTTESLRVVNLFGKIWLEALISKYVPDIYDGCLLIKEETTLIKLITSLNQHAKVPFDVHPCVYKALLHAKKPERLNKKLYRVISDIFHQNSAYSVLKTLHGARLLKYTIPPIKKVVDLPQFDGYHHFSVDMHSLKCLFFLENIDDALLRTLYANLTKKEKHLLKIVTFLHDAGKGRKKEHALVGISLFRLFATKIGLDKALISMGVTLIQYHDLMSTTAQREDLYNEKSILQFASRFKSKTLLDMIYLLTYADMNGVGGGIYTNFNAKLLRTLYRESIASLQHDKILSATARKLKKIERLKKDLQFKSFPKTIQKQILSIPANELFIYNSTEQILSIIDMTLDIGDFNYRITNKQFLTIEIVRKKTLDLAFLLSKLSRLNIVNLSVAKLFDGLKYFKIDFNEVIDESELPLVEEIIQKAFEPHTQSTLIKPEIKKSEIEIDCEHSRDYGVVRLRTKDQRGLLAFVSHLFDQLDIDIVSTKIHTSKYRVNDLFLIQKDGNFCHNTERIIKALTE